MKLALGPYEPAVARRFDALLKDDAATRIWRRDAGFWGGDAERQKSVANRLGWLDVAQEMLVHAEDLGAFGEQVCADGYRDAVVLGMGGSSLAPEVLRQTFGRREGWQGGGLRRLCRVWLAALPSVAAGPGGWAAAAYDRFATTPASGPSLAT